MRAGKIASLVLVLMITAVATAVRAFLDAPSGNLGRLWMFAVILAVVVGAIFIPIGFAFDRAALRLRQQVDQVGRASALTNFGLLRMVFQPIAVSLSGALEQRRVQEQSLRAQVNELEIRNHIADAQRRQCESVLHSLRDGVLVTDAFDEIVLANEAAAQTLDFDPHICQRGDRPPLQDVIANERLRQLIKETRQSADLNVRHVEIEIGDRLFNVSLKCMEGARQNRQVAKVLNHQIAASPAVPGSAHSAAAPVAGVVTILHDLTREREVSQMKSDFVSKASHELRTPLSSIRAYVEMLVDGEAADEEARQEFYRVIQTETDRLGRLIDNMLNISRIEAGIVQIHREQVDLRALIARAINTMEPTAGEKNIVIHGLGLEAAATNEAPQHHTLKPQTTSLTPHASSLRVEGDPDMLYQVILNLLSNAVKYTPEGGRVTVTADAEGIGMVRGPKPDARGQKSEVRGQGAGRLTLDHGPLTSPSVVVSVSDTGLGIPPEAMPKLFDKFFRIENYKRMAKGTGLGLSLCKHIVETVHHGQIGVESKLGAGSKFWFSIPMRYAGKKAA